MSSKPNAAPHDLILPLHARLSGRVRWQTLDEYGAPEPARDPSGRVVAGEGGMTQSNLITNFGLDQIAVNRLIAAPTDASRGWGARFAVGTGSTAPDVTDTALDAEVQASTSAGAYANPDATYELDTVENEWVAVFYLTRLVTMAANRNLTEFGFTPSSGDLFTVVRELFRDELGDPVTISLLSGKGLKMTHEVTVRIPAPAAGNAATINFDLYDAADTFVSSTPYDVISGLKVQSGTLDKKLRIRDLFQIWDPTRNNVNQTTSNYPAAIRASVHSAALTYARDVNNPSLASTSGSIVLEPYVDGTHERAKRVTVAAGDANIDWHGFQFHCTGGWATITNQTAFVVILDSPATYTKIEGTTVRVGLVSSWARAA